MTMAGAAARALIPPNPLDAGGDQLTMIALSADWTLTIALSSPRQTVRIL